MRRDDKNVYTPEYIEYIQLLANSLDVVSLNTAVNPDGDDDTEIGDLIASDAPSPAEIYDTEALSERVRTLVQSCVSPTEYQILTYRYGLDGKGERTLEACGKIYGVTRERIRQIEANAMRKIRRYLARNNITSREDI